MKQTRVAETRPVQIGAVVIAAGASERFGSDKRLFDNGRGALLHRTLDHILALNLPTRVALRATDESVTRALLGQGFGRAEPIYVPQPKRGMGHSIAACFENAPHWDGALLFLGDMPDISPGTGEHLISHFDQERIQVPAFEGRRGHPVLFPRTYFAELAQLTGDTGARALLQRERDNVDLHDVNDPGIVIDVDLPPAG